MHFGHFLDPRGDALKSWILGLILPIQKYLMSAILVGATSLINTLVAYTLSRAETKSTDNFLLMHYFIFNAGNAAFNAVPSCDISGYGQQICTMGSTISIALIAYRSASFAKHSFFVWGMTIWIPIFASAFFAFSDGNSFIPSKSVFACVKDYKSSLPAWTINTSILIFLSVISIILGSVAIFSANSNPIAKKRMQYQRLMATIVIDSLTSLAVAASGMILIVEKSDVQLLNVFQPVVNLSRVLLLPLFFLTLHSGPRRELYKVLTFRGASKSSNRSNVVGPAYSPVEPYHAKQTAQPVPILKPQYLHQQHYQPRPQVQPNGHAPLPLEIYARREDSFKINFSGTSDSSSYISFSNPHSRMQSQDSLTPNPKTPILARISNVPGVDAQTPTRHGLSGKYTVGPSQSFDTRSVEMIASQEQISPRVKLPSNMMYSAPKVESLGKSESVDMLSDNSVRPRVPSNTRVKAPVPARAIASKSMLRESA
jgi:hypothetical protein